MRKIIRSLLMSGVASFIFCAVVTMCLYLWLGSEYNSEKSVWINIVEVWSKHRVDVIFYGYLPASIFIIIQLCKLLNNQLDKKLLSIPTIVKNEARIFGEEIISNIAKTLNTLFENKKKSILWEFETLNLNKFEANCIDCGSGGKPHDCNKIISLIRRKRRHRITQIANCLIFDNGDFFAAESIKKPSEIDANDEQYYKEQKKFLKKHKVKKAHRFLIIRKSDLNTEINSNKNKFKKFVTINTDNTDGVPITLKIITYQNEIEDVFSVENQTISEFHDFVLAKENRLFFNNKSKITIFAQNTSDELRFYDSKKETHSNVVQRYNKWVNFICEKTEDITANVSYSNNITEFQQVIDFNTRVQSQT